MNCRPGVSYIFRRIDEDITTGVRRRLIGVTACRANVARGGWETLRRGKKKGKKGGDGAASGGRPVYVCMVIGDSSRRRQAGRGSAHRRSWPSSLALGTRGEREDDENV